MITQEKLKRNLHYDPKTGIFTWLKSPNLFFKKGKKAGTAHVKGYISINVNKKRYLAHRLAFLYMQGEIPKEVDHINHRPADNRWCNLRSVTSRENSMNKRISRRNTSGFTGVSFNKQHEKWCSSICVKGDYIYLGCFIEKEDAIKERAKAEKKYGFHKNHGKLMLNDSPINNRY